MLPFNERIVDELLMLESFGIEIPTEAFEMAMQFKETDYECMKDSDIADLILTLTMLAA